MKSLFLYIILKKSVILIISIYNFLINNNRFDYSIVKPVYYECLLFIFFLMVVTVRTDRYYE